MVGESELAFSVLGSGSGGNCVFVRGGGARVLVDAGLNLKETTARLAALGEAASGLDGILLTHEHADHVAHAGTLARRLGVPVLGTAKTRAASERYFRDTESHVELRVDRPFSICGLEIEAVQKPHDAAEPLAFLVRAHGSVLGIFTDIGHVDATVGAAMAACHAMVLEANHDPGMLARGPYPPSLKARVGGRLGHLANDDAARALARYRGADLRVVVLAHLSTTNNHPALARASFVRHSGAAPGFDRWLSTQERPTPLFGGLGSVLVRPRREPEAEAVSAAPA